MPSSHITSNFHLVFSTKDRVPMIAPAWKARLHAYLGGIIKGMDAVPLAIGGISDHAHIFASLKSKHRLDYFLRDLKADSSSWIRREFDQKFAWQKGFGAFSVSPSNVNRVKEYVLNQEEHHRKFTFEQEYVSLLEKNGIEYDKRYVW